MEEIKAYAETLMLEKLPSATSIRTKLEGYAFIPLKIDFEVRV